MFAFFKRKNTVPVEEFSPIEIPLTNIQEVDEAGILYIDNEGTSTNISYYDACKGWCKSKITKRPKPKYICDRTKSNGWQLIFHTNPKIIFCATQSQEDLWIDTINKIILQGYATFDWD